MSNQAMTWAFAQNIPSRAKCVLLALANHADHTNGHCWPSIQTIMEEASCSRRATFNFLGALARNGYVEIRKKRGADGRQRASDYWLLFDREMRPWQHSARGTEDELQDEIEEFATEETNLEDAALCAPGSGPVEKLPQNPAGAPPRTNPCTPIIEPSDSNRQNLELKDRPALKVDHPQEFSSNARQREQERLKAAEEARKQKRIPVIEGSRPWDAHVKAGHSPTLIGTIEVNGKRYRGWYFETLYPRPPEAQSLPFEKATGPPPLSELMTSEDEKQFG